MLARATSVPPGELHASAICENTLQIADGAVVERLNRRFAEQQKLNESMVAGRLASLDEAYRRQKHIREERLELARSRNRAANYIRMLEGGLRNLAAAYRQKRRELEEQRRLGRSLTVEGAGVVEVGHA